jgi:P pilus assembly chaperone PapD
MSKTVFLLTSLLALFACAGVVAAEDAVTLKGTVSVTEDETGAITAVTLTTGEGTNKVKYAVDLDAKGRELGQKAKNKSAEVTGIVGGKEGAKTLKVTVYKVAEAAKPDKPADK